MEKKAGLFRTISVYYETAREEQRTLEILGERGIRIPPRFRSGVCFRPFPSTAHLNHAEYDTGLFVCCPRPFICDTVVSGDGRVFSVPELERLAGLSFCAEPRYPVFHVPHDGNGFHDDLMTWVCIPAADSMACHEAMRDPDERILLFDIHSCWDGILPPFERGPGGMTPDLCIGTDPRCTPPRLTESVCTHFEKAGFTTAENRPC